MGTIDKASDCFRPWHAATFEQDAYQRMTVRECCDRICSCCVRSSGAKCTLEPPGIACTTAC
eukprot:COSAG01_NODE_25589_length_740_cov_0.954758_2_plen_61_part_01